VVPERGRDRPRRQDVVRDQHEGSGRRSAPGSDDLLARVHGRNPLADPRPESRAARRVHRTGRGERPIRRSADDPRRERDPLAPRRPDADHPRDLRDEGEPHVRPGAG
jgi:hypothetical protein